MCLPIYVSTVFLLDLGGFFSFVIYIQSVGLLGRGSARRKATTCTQNNTNMEYTHTNVHASSGIWSHDLSVRASEDGSCLRPRNCCDRHPECSLHKINSWLCSITFFRQSHEPLKCISFLSNSLPFAGYFNNSWMVFSCIQSSTALWWHSHDPFDVFLLLARAFSMLGGSLVTTAWCVRMEETASRYGG
jgi:hypothetical protein